jgi:protein tyrosine/serine phosphatase
MGSMSVETEISSMPMTPSAAGRARSRWRAVGGFAAVVVAAVTGGLVAWNNGLRDQVVAKNFGVVEPGRIYRSGQISARLIEPTLRAHHIQTIVALAAEGMKPADNAAEMAAAADLHIDRQLVPLAGDGTGSVQNYAAAVADVDAAVRAGRPVLVHCVAGAQRTGGVIAIYQLLVERKAPAEVLAELRRFGHDPHDNPHLLAFLNVHMAEIAQRLADRGVIERAPTPMPQLPVQ